MADRSRVPATIAEFNSYINTTDEYLLAISSGIITNRERLGLTTLNGTDWTAKRVYWRDTLYPKYEDPLQSTSALKTQVRNFMADFKEFANPLLNIMVASPNATSDDEAVFRFKIGRSEPTYSTTPIEESVVFDAKQLGGGEMKFSCRTASDSGRASKAEGADSVQIAYMMPYEETPPTPTPMPTPPDDELPSPDSEGMIREIFTKAVFIKHCGAGNVGRRMIVFLRWYNTKHPELAGPWSAIKMIIVA